MSPARLSLWLPCLFVLMPALGRAVPPPPLPTQPPVPGVPPAALARVGIPRGKDPAQGHTARVSAVAFSPDGRLLGTGSWDNSVGLWDARTGKVLHRMIGHTACIFYVAFSPDGKLLASASRDRAIRLWDTKTGKEVRRLNGHTSDVFGAAFSPDGKYLASGSFDGSARLWEVATGKEVRRFAGAGLGQVNTVRFTPDGKTLVASSNSGPIILWDVPSGKETRRLTGHTGWVYPIALSPDGRTLASGGHDGTIRLWELASGKERRRLAEGQGDVYALSISPDGRTIATASGAGNALRLWEVGSGQQRATLDGHQGSTFRLAFSSDGKVLASGSDDHTALLWDLKGIGRDPVVAAVVKPDELPGLWVDLAAGDAVRAYRAINRLASASDRSVPFLEKALQPPTSEKEPPPVAQLIANLDARSFRVRQRASAELAKLGPRVVPDLRKALAGSPSAEVRRRLEELLSKLAVDGPSGEEMRRVRVIEVLESAGTAEARRLLEALAKKAPTPEMADEAKAALARLSRQGSKVVSD
jgi:dipeptidyl aminopeptidase/acylaminoacyl peptidase